MTAAEVDQHLVQYLQRVTAPYELDLLPVGSIIADITEPDAPAVACKAVRGWQFLGDDPERRYGATALLPAPKCFIVVLWQPKGGNE